MDGFSAMATPARALPEVKRTKYFKRRGHPVHGTISRVWIGDMIVEFWGDGFTRRGAKRFAARQQHLNNITDDMGRVHVRPRHSRAHLNA